VVELDVSDTDSINAAVAHAETEMGTIDILVNNSGISTTQKLVDVTPDDYDDVMGVNTRGAFFVAQAVGRRMIARSRARHPAPSPADASSTWRRWPGCGACRRSASTR
jgi:NAD(P)-dependent dehydrogenase (short-subunit alcohol dehydrogenase family)